MIKIQIITLLSNQNIMNNHQRKKQINFNLYPQTNRKLITEMLIKVIKIQKALKLFYQRRKKCQKFY